MKVSQKRHKHVSPTLDLVAKKLLQKPQFTTALIHDILDLDVAWVEILEGTQIKERHYLDDSLFMTAVDVRARLTDGTEVIIEIQVQRQDYFVNRFLYYVLNQLIDNLNRQRKKGKTHKMYENLKPVYGIAILEKSILPEEGAVNTYELLNPVSGKQLLIPLNKDQMRPPLKFAFVELDKYNDSKEMKDSWRQWLEFFGNRQFTKKPAEVIEEADLSLDSTRWTKEERAMIDERIRIQENYAMTLETMLREGREQGIQQGIEQGVEQNTRQMVRTMFSNGASIETIAQLTGIARTEVEVLLGSGLTD